MPGGLVGSRISLISRKDIRWEGTLIHIDKENASVTLENVRSWGTEHRMPGEASIPGSPTLHDRVTFRGEDIKDLHVHETPEPLPPPPPPQGMMRPPPPPPSIPPAPHPPASIAPDAAGGGGHAVPPAQVYPYPSPSQLQPMQQPIKPVPPSPPQPSTISSRGGVGGVVEQQGSEQDGGADSPAMMRDQGLKPGRYQPPHKNPNWRPPPTVHRGPPGPVGGTGAGSGALPGQGNHLLNRRTRGAGGSPAIDDEGEFDFQAGLAKFDKEKEMAILANGISAVSVQDTTESRGNGTGTGDGGAGERDENGAPLGENGKARAAGEVSGGATPGEEGGSASGAISATGVGSAEASTSADGGSEGRQGSGSTGLSTAERMSAAANGGETWVEAPVVVKKYNKSSFFDEISCDALDGRNRNPRGRGGERTRNTETFGATSVALASRRYNGRNGGYGGYGGGYSGYSGGGRRGYHNDDYRRSGGGGDYGSRGRSYGNGDAGGNNGDRVESNNWRRT